MRNPYAPLYSNAKALSFQGALDLLGATLKQGMLIRLDGDVGAGKSFFVRTLLRKLTHNPLLPVPSPTFSILNTYDTPLGRFIHMDLYRLQQEEFWHLGIEEQAETSITLIEWPGNMPPTAIWEHTITLRFLRNPESVSPSILFVTP